MPDDPRDGYRTEARKKRRRAPREEFVDYVVEIDGWDWAIRCPSIPCRARRTPSRLPDLDGPWML